MNILNINAGSNSIKIKVYRFHNKNKVTLIFSEKLSITTPRSYVYAIDELHLNPLFQQIEINCIINRFAYGGEHYRGIVLLHEKTLNILSQYNELAPLIQPNNISIARHLCAMYPRIKHYACFDTSFHSTIPKINYDYLHDHIYGFHGISDSYIANRLNDLVHSKDAKGYWIIAHLGNSSSVCVIKNGKSVACRDIDGFGTNLLLKLSSGLSSDMKSLVESEEEAAKFAVNSYATLVATRITQLATLAGGMNGIIFTGGIGENSPEIRALVLEKLEWLGVALNKKANNNNKLKIHKKETAINVLIVPTNEGLAMVNQLIEYKL